MSSLADVVLVTLNYRWAPPGRSHTHRYLLLFLSICMLVGAARPFGASRARRSAWFAWPAHASTLTIRAPVLASPLGAARGPGLLVLGGRAPVCCAMAASPLRCAGSPHAAVAVVRDVLRVARRAQARAVRLPRARGAAQAQRERQRRQLRHPGRVSPAWQLLQGGTHGVLTESSRGAHCVANGVSRKGCSRGTRRAPLTARLLSAGPTARAAVGAGEHPCLRRCQSPGVLASPSSTLSTPSTS